MKAQRRLRKNTNQWAFIQEIHFQNEPSRSSAIILNIRFVTKLPRKGVNMSRENLRTAVIWLTGFTAIVHLVVLNLIVFQEKGSIDPLFTLNGIGYLVLLAAFLGKIPQLVKKQKLVHYLFMGFALLTILAFFRFGDMGDIVGWITKIDESLLVVALWMHLRKS